MVYPIIIPLLTVFLISLQLPIVPNWCRMTKSKLQLWVRHTRPSEALCIQAAINRNDLSLRQSCYTAPLFLLETQPNMSKSLIQGDGYSFKAPRLGTSSHPNLAYSLIFGKVSISRYTQLYRLCLVPVLEHGWLAPKSLSKLKYPPCENVHSRDIYTLNTQQKCPQTISNTTIHLILYT